MKSSINHSIVWRPVTGRAEERGRQREAEHRRVLHIGIQIT